MGAFYLTLIAVLFSGLAARDQMTIAALTRRQGQRLGVLAVGTAVAALTCAGAAYVAGEVLRTLPPPARGILAAIVLAFAGLESLILSPRKEPREPTHSLGALAIVLLASQVTDSARFTLLGLAVGTGAPLAVGLGGGLAGLVLVGAAWALPQAFAGRGVRIVRRCIGALLLLAAIAMYLARRGLL
jgi:Ca2+/H+ antiporter, TMEM165/GDT1 family